MPKGPEKRATLQAIGDELGLSVTTVSRVLNGHSARFRISAKTETAVLDLAKRLNYSPNQVARGLRLQRSMTIGLVIPDISNPFFASSARSVEMEAAKHGYSIILCDTQEDTESEIRSLQVLEDRGVDGLVVLPVGQSCEHLKKYETGSVPVVIVDRYFPDLKLPYIASDNYGGAMEAVEHLANAGHSTIACIGGLPGTTPSEERIRGYRDALKKHGIDVDESLIVGDSFGEQNGYDSAKELLEQRPDVTAIWTASSLVAMGVLRALSETQRNVPDDMSVVCFDDPAFADFLATPITAIAQENPEMGRTAVKLLLDRMSSARTGKAKSDEPENIVLPTQLRKRASVAAPRT